MVPVNISLHSIAHSLNLGQNSCIFGEIKKCIIEFYDHDLRSFKKSRFSEMQILKSEILTTEIVDESTQLVIMALRFQFNYSTCHVAGYPSIELIHIFLAPMSI